MGALLSKRIVFETTQTNRHNSKRIPTASHYVAYLRGGNMRRLGFLLFVLFSTPAWADACSDTVPGARVGPSPYYNSWPYPSGTCYIHWPGGYAAEREKYGAMCDDIPGKLLFEPDHGSNRNTCIFKPSEIATQNDDSPTYKPELDNSPTSTPEPTVDT